jgi:hypothetical protein
VGAVRRMARLPEHDSYYQPQLEGLTTEAKEEMTLEHVMVTSQPTYRKNGNGYAWDCVVSCQPDIFHQDRNETYEVHAKTYAAEAKKKRLRPGDLVTLKGIASTQTIEVVSGEKRSINHLTVSEITVNKRAKRESITVYERKQGK